MIQRSRIGPASDVRALGKRRPGQTRARFARTALKHVAALVLLVALVHEAPKRFGSDFLHDQARSAVDLAVVAGDWARNALAAAFRSIPVR